MEQDFVCPTCGNLWSQAADRYGLFGGYGIPPCPVCGDSGHNADDYGDFTCSHCDHSWRNYGNGGLVLGRWPSCPKCGTLAEDN